MWYCTSCKTRMKGTTCPNRYRDKDGNRCRDMFAPSAERFPRLDGMVSFNDDGSGIPRWEYMKQKADRYYIPKMVSGPRPQGWDTAMDAIGARAAKLIVGGLPEC